LYWIDIMPPKPLICRFAMPWPGKDDEMPVHEIEKKLAA
jgi:hypothetical protein